MAISSRSVWRGGIETAAYPQLKEKTEADVAIIGGGITGIAAAYLLRDSGLSVVLLERDRLGSRGTGATTAFLMEHLDTEASALIERYHVTEAVKMVRAHRDAINWYDLVIEKDNIDCDFSRCSAFIYATNESEAKKMREELDAMRSIGMNCAFVEQVAGIQSNGGIEIKAQAKIHPLRFLEAVAMRAAQSTRIYEKSEVIAVHEISEGIRLTTGHGEVVAQKVLMATHYPLDPQPPQLRFKKAWYNTYVIAADIESGAIPEGLYEDLGNPYHYIRIDRGDSGDHIMVGGEDHRSDVPLDKEKAFAALERFLRQFLSNAHYTITHQWYGRVVEPGDGIAYIGPIGRIFYATGYSGNGMTYGIIAAQSFAAFCRDEPPPYPEYAASRSVRLSDYLPKALDYMEEFFGGLVRRTLRG